MKSTFTITITAGDDDGDGVFVASADAGLAYGSGETAEEAIADCLQDIGDRWLLAISDDSQFMRDERTALQSRIASEFRDWRGHLSPEVRAQHEALDEYYRIQGDADLSALEIGT